MTANPQQLRTLIAACAAITIFGFAFGMTYPLLSLILESRSVAPDMIGINAAMMPLGILLFSPVIPYVTKRYGSRQVAITAALVCGLVVLGYKLFDNLPAWFLLRLIQGMSISVLFVLSEAWIVGSASDGHRGKVVAIYSSVLSASFGAGPLLISFIGIDGWMPFALGAAVLFFGAIPFLFVREDTASTPEETRPSGIFDFASRAPMLLITVAVFSIFDAATLSLIPVYGMKNGLDISTSANILTALIIGNVLLQLPIGWLCDRYPHRLVLIGCALITGALMLLIPIAILTPWVWPLLVIVGTTGYGVYTVALTSLGQRFKGLELINGTAAFAVVWGIGALIGSMSGGWAMAGFGPHGLPISLALLYLLLFAGLTWRQVQKS